MITINEDQSVTITYQVTDVQELRNLQMALLDVFMCYNYQGMGNEAGPTMYYIGGFFRELLFSVGQMESLSEQKALHPLSPSFPAMSKKGD